MCLRKLDPSITITGVGYKVGRVFRHAYNDSDKFFVTVPRSALIPFGRYVANDIRVCVETENGEPYVSGFHVYLDREDAVRHCARLQGSSVVEVRFPFKGVVTGYVWGRDDKPGCPVAVCQEIKLGREIFYASAPGVPPASSVDPKSSPEPQSQGSPPLSILQDEIQPEKES